jgi:hypothetical protein
MDRVSAGCFAVARSGNKDFSREWRGISSLRMKFSCVREICQRGANRRAEARRLKASRACRVEKRRYLDILRPLPFPGTPENGMDVTQNEKIRQCMPAICCEFFRKSFGNRLKEVWTGRTTCKNWLARANTCDRLAPNAACTAINPNSAGCWSEQRREFDSGGLGRWASFFSSSSG